MSEAPARFDRNLIVIGAGSAGLVAAYIAAAVNARVTLIEKHRMGGDCLNTGCVPSKALIKSARVAALIRRAGEFGIKAAAPEVDFRAVMGRVRAVIDQIKPHDSVERYEGLGVECIQGEARITSPWTVAVNGQTLSARSLIIATGARPFIPPIPGLAEIDYLSSDNLWQLNALPKRLLALGGGPIGCELAQAFQRLGSRVTQVEREARLLAREDPEIARLIQRRFAEEGVDIRAGHRALEVIQKDGHKRLICEHAGQSVEIEFDRILCAVGRAPNSAGFGLEELGVKLNPDRTICVNAKLQTSLPNIYACGDVAGPYQFTHTAAHQAWYAAVNALFGRFKRFKADYTVIPWATFTDPEVARVGLNEQDARRQGVGYEVTHYGLEELDRAITEGEARGVVKVLTAPGRDKILGATIVGDHAGELITEYISAMRQGFGMNRILGTIHIYPTLSEANKFAAGAWKKAHAPRFALALLKKYHRWMLRG